jgi:hypothetical protein
MIGNCFNPECNEELHYLRQGSVYQLESGPGQKQHSEFFWLCPACSCTFKVASDDSGMPILAPCSAKPDCRQRCSRVRRVLTGLTQEHSRAHNEIPS